MQAFLNSPFTIGRLELPNRLLQGPLAGFSCAPFRQLYYQFIPPAYCVSEMISAFDVLYKHFPNSRYLYRAPEEERLCYQLAGNEPAIMAKAAMRLEKLGADLIDINCGCPKTKIRKKKFGSALLDDPTHLLRIVSTIRDAIDIPLTVKIRIQGDERDMFLAEIIEKSGADALIVHGRRWLDDYAVPCDFETIQQIKKTVKIPVIANGDIMDKLSLSQAIEQTACDAYMIARAGSGKPWFYQNLLAEAPLISNKTRINYFLMHLEGLLKLENEYKAVLQSKTLVRYYFGKALSKDFLQDFYTLNTLLEIEKYLNFKINSTK